MPRRVQSVFGHFCDIFFGSAIMSRNELPAHADHSFERVWSVLEDNSSLTRVKTTVESRLY
jgi:hypothetical protein